MDHVTAIFKTRPDAENALRQLESLGITDSQTSMIVSDETRGKAFKIENTTRSDEGAALGAAAGGIAGALIAALLSAGAIAIPGLNLVVAGYLISGLAGLGAGAAAGGLIGALVGLGFEENEAKFYESEIKGGNILVAVKTRNGEEKKRVKEVLNNAKSYGFDSASAANDPTQPLTRKVSGERF